MSQISPPIRIFLAVAALFLVAWMTVLKPKAAEDVSAPTPITTGNVATGKPAVSAVGKLAEKAKGTVENANSKQSAAMGETSTTGSTPATGTATKTVPTAPGAKAAAAGDLAGLPAPVAKAIRKQKVLVVGFFNNKASDDRDVRKAMFKVDRWNGRVFVTAASIGKISGWGRITRGVDLEQSPTVVVIGTDLKATSLVGFVDTRTIDQAVVDSLHNTGGLFASAYLRKVNGVCASNHAALFANPLPNVNAEVPKRIKRTVALRSKFVADLRAVKAPARYKAFKAATVADAATIRDGWAKLARDLGPHPTNAAGLPALGAAAKTVNPAVHRFAGRMRKNHLPSCSEL